MISLLNWFNAAVTWFFDLLLYPFSGAAPVWGLIFISVLSGVLLLLVYGRVSNQAAIRQTKRKIGSLVLEAIIYRRDLGTSLKAQAKMLGQACVYVGHAVVPLLILMVPCLVILAQLNLRYNARGLKPGEQAILAVKAAPGVAVKDAALRAPAGLKAAPPVRVPESGEVFWRLEGGPGGVEKIAIEVGGRSTAQEIFGAPHRGKLPAGRYRSFWLNFFYPGAPAFEKDAPLSEVYLAYPEASYRLLGIEMHWLAVFAIVSILAGLVAAKLLGVEI